MLATITLSPFLLMAALLPPVHAEIYRCTGKGGLAVYQNFPCDVDRLALGPSKSTNASASAMPSSGDPVRRDKAPLPTAPRLGMTSEEVRRIWGEPLGVTTEEFARKDVEVWSYADSRSIEFDRKGRVTHVRW